MSTHRTIVTTLERNDVEQRVYDAECALHAAHQTGQDDWIARAADRLHDVLAEYLATR